MATSFLSPPITELTFVADDSVAYGAHIASILNTLDIKPEEDEEEEEV